MKTTGTPDEQPLEAYRKQLIDLLSDPSYQPQKLPKLLRQMRAPASARPGLREIVGELLSTGVIVELKRKGLALARSADLAVGNISFTRSGAAFVAAQDPKRDVFVAASQTGTALPGDRVVLRISSEPQRPTNRRLAEGTVIRVLERHCHTIVGTLKRVRRVYYVEPMRSGITHDVVVPDPAGANVGDRVLVTLAAWDDPHMSPEGEIEEVLGPADNPALDTIAVIHSFGLPTSFPKDVVAEAEAAAFDERTIEGRLDFRKHFVFTVDPVTARDYDDAISLERVRGGKWRLGVHIADVSHFVQAGSALDREARKRGTSVYLPDQVLPMLPEQLANGLCSLTADKDRLAFSVFMTLDDEGRMLKAEFHKSAIHSRLRLTYQQALALLETPEDAPLPEPFTKRSASPVREVSRLAQKMRQRRFADGAMQMTIPEVRPVLGDDGRIARLEVLEDDISHQMIEECMLLANEAVCRELDRRGLVQLHRIHDEPDPEKLADLEGMFWRAGIEAGDLGDRANLQRLLARFHGQPQAPAWYAAVLRSMKRACYSTECRGHYGLAKTHYAHFTSPIRRYPDLVTHRLLKAALAGEQPAYGAKALAEIADHSSQRENVATEAEREIIDLKRLRFFAEQISSGDIEDYAAVVTEVRNSGAFIFVPDVQAMGMIHVSQLSDDFFDYNAARQELRGRRSGQVFRLGVTLRVVIARVDEARKFLDFAPVRAAPEKNQASRARGKKRRRRA